MVEILEKTERNRRLNSNERGLLHEFVAVIRRHNSQPPATLTRMAGLALESTIGSGKSRDDKLLRAKIRGLGVRQQLAEAEGGSYSADEAARILGISKTAVLKRHSSGKLLGWREERLRAVRFPVWQFDEHGHVLNGLEEVLKILNQDDRLDGWGKILFFLQEKSSFDGRRALDLLREGRLKDVQVAGEAYVE